MNGNSLTLFTVKVLRSDRLVVLAEIRQGVIDIGDPQRWLAEICDKVRTTNQVISSNSKKKFLIFFGVRLFRLPWSWRK